MGIIRYSKVPVLENLSLLDVSCLMHSIFKSLFQFYKIFYCCCHVRSSLKGSTQQCGFNNPGGVPQHYILARIQHQVELPLNPSQTLLSEDSIKTVSKLTLNLSYCTHSKDTIMCEDPVHFQKFLGGES